MPREQPVAWSGLVIRYRDRKGGGTWTWAKKADGGGGQVWAGHGQVDMCEGGGVACFADWEGADQE